jgi:hypothetical protein
MTTDKLLILGTLLAGVCGTTGCQPVKSTNIRTSGVYAEFNVNESGATEATVGAWLRVGGPLSNTYLVLDGPDQIIAQLGGDSARMQGHSFGDYSVKFPYPAVDTEVRAIFERGPDDINAPDSTAILPGMFAVAPLAKTTYSRAVDALEIQWSPFDATQRVAWHVSGSCIDLVGASSATDAGVLKVPAGTLKKYVNHDESQKGAYIPDECTATVSVKKERLGQVDPAYEGGSFKASEERTTTFTTVP